MGEEIFLIVGLGNPGPKYDGTRHNIGFVVVDLLAQRHDCLINLEKWEAVWARTVLFRQKVYLIKPQTYMNLSGKAVAKFVDFYKIPLRNLLVIHDDLDMRPGRIKLLMGGGHGGHNGIRSIVQYLGGRDFYRLKIGIGRPGQGGIHSDVPVEDYVLSKFLLEEKELVVNRLDSVLQGIQYYLQNDASKAMNLLNSLK
jgi:PTH1 family peptidyl-tRNA hydrolase